MPTAEQIQKIFQPLFPGLMGVTLEEATQDKIVATMLVRPDLCTTGGVCHGGAFMAFADTIGAVGTVMNLPPNTRTTTIESKTNFLGAAPVNTRVTAEFDPAASRQDHAGVADHDPQRGRQALRRRHPDANGPAARSGNGVRPRARRLTPLDDRVVTRGLTPYRDPLRPGIPRPPEPKSRHIAPRYAPGPEGRKRVPRKANAGRATRTRRPAGGGCLNSSCPAGFAALFASDVFRE